MKFKLTKKVFFELLHLNDREKYAAKLKNSMESGQRLKHVFRAKNSSCEWRYFETIVSVVFDNSGEIISLCGIIQDINDCKQAEGELAETKGILEIAIAQFTLRILIADVPDVLIHLGNAAAFGIWGEDQKLLKRSDVAQRVKNWQIFLPNGPPYPAE